LRFRFHIAAPDITAPKKAQMKSRGARNDANGESDLRKNCSKHNVTIQSRKIFLVGISKIIQENLLRGESAAKSGVRGDSPK